MNKSMMLVTVAVVFSVSMSVMLISPALAQETESVRKLAKAKIDTVIGLLKNKAMPKEERNKKIIETVNPLLDFQQMARLSLGKKHWIGIGKENQKVFVDHFVERLQESYLEKLDLYTDEKVVVEEAKQVKTRIYVMTYLVSKDDKNEMIYKFYKTKSRGWMVYDVEILGVSVVQTYRSQFSGFLNEHSYDQLLERIKTPGGFTIDTEKKK